VAELIHIDHVTLNCVDSTSLKRLLKPLMERIESMAQELDALTAAVERNTTVDQSAITLINGIAQQLRDMANNATELADLKAAIVARASELEASNQQVADAVTANTPAA
jgi:hypothetical protein